MIRVDFDPNGGIPADAQEEISEALRRRSRVFEPDADGAYLKDLANEISEVTVRGALRDRGYFNAAATAKLTPRKTEGADISVVVTMPGLQYRTGDIGIKSSDSGNRLQYRPKSCEVLSRSREAKCSVPNARVDETKRDEFFKVNRTILAARCVERRRKG